jgi:serine phosphatase RsbU (regulator of sigma subunit)
LSSNADGDVPVSVSLRAEHPAADAARSGRPVRLHSPEAIASVYPDLDDMPWRARVALPFRNVRGDVRAVLEVGWDQPVTFDGSRAATLTTIAEQCGQTLERCRLHEAEHQLVHALQERLLRPIPRVAELDVAARYLPADTTGGMGGDFYHGLLTAPHRLALIVGDVTGHGMDAAADMAQLRTVLSTLLAAGTPLHDVYSRTEQALAHEDPPLIATAAIAVVDTAAGTISLAAAGHPPPLVVQPDGRCDVVEAGRRCLLGVAGRPVLPVTMWFPPGALAVLYTDGLVERRNEAIDDGIQRLAQLVVDGRNAPAALLANRVLAGLSASDREDDTAVVVVRHRPG